MGKRDNVSSHILASILTCAILFHHNVSSQQPQTFILVNPTTNDYSDTLHNHQQLVRIPFNLTNANISTLCVTNEQYIPVPFQFREVIATSASSSSGVECWVLSTLGPLANQTYVLHSNLTTTTTTTSSTATKSDSETASCSFPPINGTGFFCNSLMSKCFIWNDKVNFTVPFVNNSSVSEKKNDTDPYHIQQQQQPDIPPFISDFVFVSNGTNIFENTFSLLNSTFEGYNITSRYVSVSTTILSTGPLFTEIQIVYFFSSSLLPSLATPAITSKRKRKERVSTLKTGYASAPLSSPNPFNTNATFTIRLEIGKWGPLIREKHAVDIDLSANLVLHSASIRNGTEPEDRGDIETADEEASDHHHTRLRGVLQPFPSHEEQQQYMDLSPSQSVIPSSCISSSSSLSSIWAPDTSLNFGFAYCDPNNATNSTMDAISSPYLLPLAPINRLPNGALAYIQPRWSQACDSRYAWGIYDSVNSPQNGNISITVVAVKASEFNWPQYRGTTYDTMSEHLFSAYSDGIPGHAYIRLPLYGIRSYYLLVGPRPLTLDLANDTHFYTSNQDLDRFINVYDLSWKDKSGRTDEVRGKRKKVVGMERSSSSSIVNSNATLLPTSLFAATTAQDNDDTFCGQWFLSENTNPTHTIRALGTSLLDALSTGQGIPTASLCTLSAANVWNDPDWFGSFVGHQSPENNNFFTDFSTVGFAYALSVVANQHPRAQWWCDLAWNLWLIDLEYAVTLPSGAGQESPGYTEHAIESWARKAPLLDQYCPTSSASSSSMITMPPRGKAVENPRYVAAVQFLYNTSQPWAYHFLGPEIGANNGQMSGRFGLPLGDTHPTSINFTHIQNITGIPWPDPTKDWTQLSEELAGFGVLFRAFPGLWNETFLAFKASPNRGHNHGDQLSIHYASYGSRIVIDIMAGYNPRPYQESWHNRLCVGPTNESWTTNLDGFEQLLGFSSTISSAFTMEGQKERVGEVAVGQVVSNRLQYIPANPPEAYLGVYPTWYVEGNTNGVDGSDGVQDITYRRTVVFVRPVGESKTFGTSSSLLPTAIPKSATTTASSEETSSSQSSSDVLGPYLSPSSSHVSKNSSSCHFATTSSQRREYVVLVDAHSAWNLGINAYTSLTFEQEYGVVANPLFMATDDIEEDKDEKRGGKKGSKGAAAGLDMGNGTLWAFASNAENQLVDVSFVIDVWNWTSEGNETATRVRTFPSPDAFSTQTSLFVSVLYPGGSTMKKQQQKKKMMQGRESSSLNHPTTDCNDDDHNELLLPADITFNASTATLTIQFNDGYPDDVLWFGDFIIDATISTPPENGSSPLVNITRDGGGTTTTPVVLLYASDVNMNHSQGDIGFTPLDAGYTFGEAPDWLIAARVGPVSDPNTAIQMPTSWVWPPQKG